MPTDLDNALKESADYLNGELEKQAQNQLEGLLESIPDEAKTALRNALVGGLIGAGGGAYAGGPGSRMKGMLAGGGLGALTGGAATLGSQLLGGQLRLPGEQAGPQSILGGLAGGATGAAASNPGLLAGGALGGIGAYRLGPRSGEIMKYLRSVATKDPQARQVLADLEGALGRPGIEYVSRGLDKIREPLTFGQNDVLERISKLRRSKHLTRPEKVKSIYAQLKRALTEGEVGGVAKTIGGAAKRKGSQLAAAGGDIASAARINRILKLLPQTMKRSKLPWMLAPAGIGAGYLVDKYLKGEY